MERSESDIYLRLRKPANKVRTRTVLKTRQRKSAFGQKTNNSYSYIETNVPNLSKICHLEVFKNFILELGWKVNTLVKRLKSGTEECRVVQYLICTFFRPIQIQSFLSFSLELLQCSRATCIINVSLRETSRMHTGVFRRAAQSLVRPWALILGGRLYGASI